MTPWRSPIHCLPHAAGRWLLWWVLGCLLSAQTLGLLHRSVHGLGHAGAPAWVAVADMPALATPAGLALLAGGTTAPDEAEATQDQADDPPRPTGWAALFLGHAPGADCQLYDALSHGDGLTAPPLLVFTAALPQAVLATQAGAALVRWAALFDARGPPPVR